MASVEEALKKLGELFIIGFSGFELSDETAAFISQAGIGGVIFFAHNYENPAQLAELSNQVQGCRAELPLWVCVDHEGGRVQRFKKAFTRIPDAHAIGRTNSPKLAFDIGEIMAKELKAVGVNVNFCPVADITTNPKNPVIGARAYGTDEETVSKMSTAIVRGHLVNGVQPCVKHFPGHGDTSTDSHYALPRIDTSLDVLKDREFKPFVKAFKGRCAMVMTAHILNPKIDPKFPATLSKIVIQDILRKELRYTRLIISDDMEMKAITGHFGPEDAPRLAIEAGCDLLIYRSEAAARAAYEALAKALKDGKLSAETVIRAADRSRAFKKESLLPYQPVVVAEVGKQIGLPESAAVMEKVTASG
jgi:beta-N-acetylhexosaminidase